MMTHVEVELIVPIWELADGVVQYNTFAGLSYIKDFNNPKDLLILMRNDLSYRGQRSHCLESTQYGRKEYLPFHSTVTIIFFWTCLPGLALLKNELLHSILVSYKCSVPLHVCNYAIPISFGPYNV